MEIYIIAAIAALVGLFVLTFYNGAVKLRNGIEEAFATMDVFMKKRYDLIPNLVETVKGYATHERETFEAITAARVRTANATSTEERLSSEAGLQSALKSLFAVAESYPDLKANQNFLSLQADLASVEDEIASSRRYYNGVVKQFNDKILVFPGNLIAGMFGFLKQPMYEVAGEEERGNVSVKF